MSANRQFEFFLLRYAPDAIKDEFVNIGVVLLGTADNAAYAKVRMTRDWRRVLCMDPDADLDLFNALGRDLEAQLSALPDRAALMKRMQESFSGAIQLTDPRACLTDQPQEHLDLLTRYYLETRHVAREREYAGRQRILRLMQDEFERAGVWALMKHKIPVEPYTIPGDPLKIDCAYRPDGIMKMFHAVPLTTSADLAKILAFTFPMIVKGMNEKERLAAALTAIVDTTDRARPDVAFALETLESAAIAVAPTEDLPAIAGRARQDLHA